MSRNRTFGSETASAIRAGLRLSNLQRGEVFLLIAIGILFFARLALLSSYPVLDKSEARYAVIAMRMFQSGEWITPTVDGLRPFWAKPPLAFWLTAASYAIFGINEFAARVHSLLIFGGMMWLVAIVGERARDRASGLLAACIFGSMLLAYASAGVVLTDPALSFGVTLSIVAFWVAMHSQSRAAGYLVFIGFGVALLAKGPLGIVIPGLAVGVWLTTEGRWGEALRRLPLVAGLLVTVAIALPWYVSAEMRTPGFLRYFIIGEHIERYLVPNWRGDLYGAGRQMPLGTVWPYAFLAMLPWSIAVLWVLIGHRPSRATMAATLRDPWIRYLLAWSIMPLLFFTFARNLLVSYVQPMLPPLALLVAHVLREAGEDRRMQRIVAVSAIIPVVMVALQAYVHVYPYSKLIPSQAGIVALWKAQPTSPESNLVYLFDKPFSADFYTLGSARLIYNLDQVTSLLNRNDRIFLVVSATDRGALPASLLDRIEMVGERNDSLLFKRRESSGQ